MLVRLDQQALKQGKIQKKKLDKEEIADDKALEKPIAKKAKGEK